MTIKLITLVTLVATAAMAAPTKFSCSNVGGTAEWTVYVDLEQKKAGFFDNDNTAVVPLVNVESLESRPPQMVYTFEGKDTGGGTNEVLQISFNYTKRKAYVTFNPKPGAKTLEALDGCVVDNNINF